MVPLAQAAGSAPCYHTSWVAPRVTTLWGLAGWGAPPQRTEQPWPVALHPGSPGAASRGTSSRTALLQAAGALHPASMCSVCSAVHRSSLSEIGLEMCVPMFLAP